MFSVSFIQRFLIDSSSGGFCLYPIYITGKLAKVELHRYPVSTLEMNMEIFL